MKTGAFRSVTRLVGCTVPGLAHAGPGPADKVATNDLPGAATAPFGIVDTEPAAIPLAMEGVKRERRHPCLRHLTIGGTVNHEHAATRDNMRQAQARTVDRSLSITRSNQRVPSGRALADPPSTEIQESPHECVQSQTRSQPAGARNR